MLILRRHRGPGHRSHAVSSSCGAYRYLLSRRFGPGPRILWVMLNPSTADERTNDRTIARCEAFSRRWGYGRMEIANLFAFRATRPADLRRAADPVGPQADRLIDRAAVRADMVMAGWGVHGALAGRNAEVLARLPRERLHALAVTRDGHPGHPLYIRGDARPVPFGPDI
ncbi:DUF1643 domain-containing protein [Wenxinia saemankumensis]|uniref:DUF1643 domain-containing protein n=1 Tax=Wenxinia saemankumensis TaxID=1447782 RepID=A0A1M6EBJ0_9RHOB|nr:DUF1643 domain-containing protein [Wenxinia saemankumensis]SHI82842.1 hypothetical protein SAMN05444417_1919 [Wenxinia saemankumensis]